MLVHKGYSDYDIFYKLIGGLTASHGYVGVKSNYKTQYLSRFLRIRLQSFKKVLI
jgi:hypothetical protein